MIRKAATRKTLACFFLGILTLETLLPTRSLALTSGPKQPETSQFAAASTSEMVDLFTGDFKYNIPLIDVDGYPVNLNYASGIGMDDEASWVGLGWNLNVGAINRQLRGIADDASGDDVIVENYMKPKITVGARMTHRAEIAGWNDYGRIGLNGSLNVSIFSDNYNGYGADVGVGAGVSQSLSMGGSMTTALTMGVGISMNSSTQDGVTLSPSLSLSVQQNMDDVSSVSAGLSANLGYNTREGLKSTTLGASFSLASGADDDDTDGVDEITARGSTGYSTSASKTTYNTPPFYPRSGTAFKTKSTSYGFDIGGEIYLLSLSGGLTGYKTVREILNPLTKTHAYGFMYAERGKQKGDALLDFMREKDNPVVPNLQNLAIPIATPDLFSYSGQAGGGQFRLYRGTTGVFADAYTEDKTDISSLSTEYGFGAYFHGGMTYTKEHVSNKTGKWRAENDFLVRGDYPAMEKLGEEQAYFKMVGEKNMSDPAFDNQVHTDGVVKVGLNGRHLTNTFQGGENHHSGANPLPEEPFRKKGRQYRRSPILALTAEEAENAALDKEVFSWPFNAANTFSPDPCNLLYNPLLVGRITADRKPHHLSEMTIQDDNGGRMVYGIPVYNTKQIEYTFSVDPSLMTQDDKDKNLVPYQFDGGGNIKHKHEKTDHYYRKETQPAYATSYLLTGVLSPDYIDLQGDGITDDDPGTAVKFNYSKVQGTYKWRAPFAVPGTLTGRAQYNKGLQADDTDDKGNIVYGEKELWYLHSIQSKTKIAYFITEDREDALGVMDEHGAINTTVRQKLLKEIRIFSKTDLETPIKTVVFDYDYSLCQNSPNSISTGKGKLTLKRVYFKYNNSDKGKYHPYTFTYQENQPYNFLSSDRWGSYKGITDNADANEGFAALRNDEFPYTDRSALADENAKTWHLSKIELPTGGEIEVDYESDDYSYVQDKKAMQMTAIDGLIKNGTGEAALNLRDAQGFKFKLTEEPEDVPEDAALRKDWFIRNYLSGKPYLYAKLFINISDHPLSQDDQYYDYIPCYAEISDVQFDTGDSKIVYLLFKSAEVGNVTGNPFSFAAWQKMRLEYPRYAYPGYKNRIDDDRPVAAAVTALASAISNFSELKMNFNKKADKKHFAEAVKLEKSFLRIAAPKAGKNGGGVRVSKLRILDKWDAMAENTAGAIYGQSYDYRMMENGKLISSGVAAYEPSIGGDENPMRMPLPYSQESMWALTNLFYLEEPMVETLFPAPQVGYRRVAVSNLAADGQVSDAMGSSVNEYYTAKEFPVIVDNNMAEKVEAESKRWYPFFGADYSHELYMSQGYQIILNDMHGKPFKETILNKAGEEISAVEYVYNSIENGGRLQLDNSAIPVMKDYGKVQEGYMSREIELFADMREQETASTNKIYNLGVDVIPTFLPFPTPFPHIPVGKNNDYRLFRSSSVLKTVANYGVLMEVIKTVNGSTIKTNHLAFDHETGEVLLTKTQNEFESPIYTLTIPAYYVHGGMGMAYRSLNAVISDFEVNAAAEIPYEYESVLVPGDEIINLATGRRSWVIRSAIGEAESKLRLIDIGGRLERDYVAGKVKVCRSGYRNLLTAKGATFVTLKDPRGYPHEDLSGFFNEEITANFPMLDTKAILYHEAWGRPADCVSNSCPEGYVDAGDGKGCVINPTANTTLSVVPGDTYWQYGDHGVRLYNDQVVNDNAGWYDDLGSGYWMGGSNSRLWQAGVKMPNVPTNTWWGLEACFTAPREGWYYLGFASDNFGHYYIDGFLKASQTALDPETSLWWRIIQVHLTAGKHTVRVDAANGGSGSSNPESVAVEIYDATRIQMMSGALSLGSKRIFSTEWLRDDASVSCFTLSSAPFGPRTAARYTCKPGKTLNICDGTPNCGYKLKGDCPDGYTKSADGMSCIAPKIVDNGTELDVVRAPDHPLYDRFGARLYDEATPSGQVITNSYYGGVDCPPIEARTSAGPYFYCGRLNSSGVRLTSDFSPLTVAHRGLSDCVTIPSTGTYYIGLAGIKSTLVSIDGEAWKARTDNNSTELWRIYPIELTAGQHVITVESEGVDPGDVPIIGVELYSGSRADVVDGLDAEVLWSTTMALTHTYNSFLRGPGSSIYRAKSLCGTVLTNPCTNSCEISVNGVMNPYYTGFLGNWSVWKEYVYMDTKPDNGIFDPAVKDLNIRKSGAYVLTTPFYGKHLNGGYTTMPHNNTIPGWVVAREATMQDRTSQELESKDALGRYSSARFGFRGVLPVAVASNARHREIFYDGFEDYKFYNNCLAKPTCDAGDFDIRKTLGTDYDTRLEKDDAHSGNFSLKLSSTEHLILNTWQFNNEHTPGIYLSNNLNGEFYRSLIPWLGLWGFAPMDEKQYVFSAWVKDAAPLTDETSIRVSLNGGADITPTRNATVEGWKLVECTFTMPLNTEGVKAVNLTIKAGATTLIDDIRIFPFDAQIKTFSYDDRTLRLMGEMDENNYATFYEYDDEGSLTRVKKETDRGILTIKESKTGYKKKPFLP
ncbi:hypothetical protein GFS24_06470 [Chitinophaga sp. SYP-B3965]|uniref:hypothetical protein n=1 Tax=Chitinophaga sp. SYP-B3965 TaxID=2663120 RepID=UPI0012997453|nr:hypothetical protein [Chitinophaga sp. SYP-B3965]MRG44749.1 hypothetical protein [Chitinophaga sp. SYP-B3965]